MNVAEKVLSRTLTKLIKAAGTTGYTVNTAGGEVSRNVRSSGEQGGSPTLPNVRIAVLTDTRELAERISRAIESRDNKDDAIFTDSDQMQAVR